MKSDERDEGASIPQAAGDQAASVPRESEAQFRELMAHLQQVFWIKNAADDAVVYVSPAYAAIGGRTLQSLYDDFRTFLDAVHPEDRERVARAMAGQRETGGYEEEYRILRPDGALRWIWARSYPVRDEQGRVIRFAGIAEDITERKALELDRARLAAIVEYSDDAIVSMSVDCIIIGWNRGAERQYGYTAEEVVGCPLSILFPPDQYAEYQRTLESVRHGEHLASRDTVRRRKDGTLVHASVNIFPIEVRNRELAGASKISRDVTAIKRLEAQFVAAQKMEVVGQLAAGMAHDFNNLLSVILGCSDMMMLDLAAGAPMRRDLETIQQAAERAVGLTRQLLVFSRKEHANPVVLDVNDLVAGLEKMLRQLVDENIDLTVVRGSRVGRVKADAGHLGQLLFNLVINARDAMPDGGGLSITTGNAALDDEYARAHPGVTAGDYVVLTVRDTGTGMTEEVKARLFEPFFTTKEPGKGTGLGLATCDTIVKQCGGHIAVRSEAGHGSTFDVYLPAAAEPLDTAPQPSADGATMPRGAETLLVVEGERAVRELARGVLESLGYVVLHAANVREALRVAAEHPGRPIRLIVTDVGLPQLHAAQARLVFTSECAYEVAVLAGLPPEGTALLRKPFTASQLAGTVRALLDSAGPSS
ncbi:MAG: PAS domain S-box protein [Deltaproteobacteria bacterium]|nr:PAS domain S-box protein [Deltaproteobacteria bacterium]